MKVALCHGSFCLPHPGHLWHFQEARKLADRLVVTITADPYLDKPYTPPYTHFERATIIAAWRCVDEVRIIWDSTGIPAIQHYRPDFYVKGGDYKDSPTVGLDIERNAVEAYGGRLVLTGHSGYASRKIIERIRGTN